MTTSKERLKGLVEEGRLYVSKASEIELSKKINPSKWSKKEILGHLVDSAINNLQRFTEIQFEKKPYRLKRYNQNDLVKANNYQNSDITIILNLWIALNEQIMAVIANQNYNTLKYKVELEDGEDCDLEFLIVDYTDHLEHHLNQIKA